MGIEADENPKSKTNLFWTLRKLNGGERCLVFLKKKRNWTLTETFVQKVEESAENHVVILYTTGYYETKT